LIISAGKDPTVGLSEEELYGNFWIFILAGHETTAGALTYALILLALNPEVQEKLYKEVTKVIENRLPVYEDYPHLLYPQYIMKETLRLFPIVTSINKMANKDTTLKIPLAKYKRDGGKNISNLEEMVTVTIPQGTVVILHMTAVHRNPLYWIEPEKFIPERFDPTSDVKKYREEKKTTSEDGASSDPDFPYHRQAYIPFSDGIRSCIGRKFSEIEFAFVLSLISQNYTVHLAPEMNRNTVLESIQLLTLRPKEEVQLIFRKREGVQAAKGE